MKVHWDSVPEKAKTLDWGITNPNLVYQSTYLPTEIWRSALWVGKWLEGGAASKLFINNRKHKNKLTEAWDECYFLNIYNQIMRDQSQIDFRFSIHILIGLRKQQRLLSHLQLHFYFANFQFHVSVTSLFVPTYLQITRSRIS